MPALTPSTEFNPASPEVHALIESALPPFKEALEKAREALEKAKKSSARWANPARDRAAIKTVASETAGRLTPCSLDNLTNYVAVFNTLVEIAKQNFENPRHPVDVDSIAELIASHQSFQNKRDDTTQRKVDERMQNPARLGLSAEVLNQALPDNTPDELATQTAAWAIYDIMQRAAVDVSQLNVSLGPGISRSVGV